MDKTSCQQLKKQEPLINQRSKAKAAMELFAQARLTIKFAFSIIRHTRWWQIQQGHAFEACNHKHCGSARILMQGMLMLFT